ncbi:MAG: DUF362 domain-containing protein [Candidatus Heimdallarchaeota archaeon]|nr:DUF362 domain-containing protein [Candidatus Heimdallarchaeota archaeon]MBY8995332.1 DUF362 domain-containing protein [Candidatus Heimdallarchaeota archaeon]
MITIIENTKQLKSHLYEWLEQKNFVGHMQNKKILLKPNMGYPKPAPFTTSTEIIRAVVELLSELNSQQIIIGEGSTSHSNALENFEATGLIEELKDFKVQFIDLNKQESDSVELSNNVTHYLPKLLKQVDIRISMPVIKFYDDDEGEFFLSNAIKNFFGLPPKEKYQKDSESEKRDSLHNDLHKSVVEIFHAVENYAPFDLYICDGTKVLEGEATIGQAKHWGKIVISDNALEADLKVLEILKKPLPKYLRLLA